jgi:uroporphyrinogen-III synthase
MGLAAVKAPLFSIHSLEWSPPEVRTIDGLLITSANAARHSGPQLRAFSHLPCFATGEATAAAVREGFADVHSGPSDGAAALASAVASGATRLLHLCGRDHIPLEHPGVTIVRRIVYAAESEATLPEDAAKAAAGGAVALIHSPRAGATFARLVDAAGLDRSAVTIAAISEVAVVAAGPGWRRVASAAAPRDEALLELAVKLCKTRSGEDGK